MGFEAIPYTTGHETFFIGGALFTFEYSVDGESVVTITHGDPWKVVVSEVSPEQFVSCVASAIGRPVREEIIINQDECGTECETQYNIDVAGGMNRYEARARYQDCIARCYGVGGP